MQILRASRRSGYSLHRCYPHVPLQVFRVTGLPALKPDDELKAALAAAIDDHLSVEEQSTLDVRTAIVPSCYDHVRERVALVEFHGGVPVFLTADPLVGWQVEMGDADINFD
jgi:hypothetical protein